ncbi:MAG TPA: PKD domain-containing protein [Flavobacteriales bacterium]|nr:PKD domain-containing protein [Flavobacteriales bacterium]
MKKFLLVLFFIPLFVYSQQKKEVLFIGNSYTYVNDLPTLVEQIALTFGDTLIHDSSTPGGANFSMHSANSQTISKINQQQWDYVVLQAQSQEPSLSPGYVNTNVYPAVQTLIDIIEQSSLCIEPMFFMTWGRKYGDAGNCVPWPPVCTYLGMQEQLRLRYLDFAFIHNASCAPVGMAWKQSIAQDSALNLFSPDNSHPSIYGSYLAACTFYTSIFKKSPIGSSFWPNSIDSITAYNLQQIASNTVLDSLTVWNIFNADFTFVQNNDSISFSNLSSNFDSIVWNFGDGNTSTSIHPNHIYSGSGNFTITLTAYTNSACQIDTSTATISISIPSAIKENTKDKILIRTTDIQGRNCTPFKIFPSLYFYNDGTVEKKVILE